MSEATIPVRGLRRGLPRSIGRLLLRLGLALRLAGLCKGLGTTAMVMALGAALGMVADFAWELAPIVRWALWATWLLAAGLALIASGIRPMLRRFGSFELAAAAEAGHPELGESLTGAVALLGSGTPHGSPELIAALADQADRSCRALRSRNAAAWSRAARRLGLGMVLVGLIVVPAMLRPDTIGVLARRFLMPWADVDRLSHLIITVEPGDRIVAAGSDVTFTARVRPLLRLGLRPVPKSARLDYVDASGGRTQHHEMRPEPASAEQDDPEARRFTLTIPGLRGSLDYRVSSGDDTSRRHRITALEPPAVASIRAHVQPPGYTKRPPGLTPSADRIEAFEGSLITLEMTANRPVRSWDVEWPAGSGQPRTAKSATLADGGRKATFSAEALASGPYRFDLRDEHGIHSRPDDDRRVIVRPDQPPSLTVRGHDEIKEASPTDRITIGFTTRDDVAVAAVELHYTIRRGGSSDGEKEKGHREVTATGLGSPAARGVAALPLSSLGLKPGDVVSYRLRVADNRPAPRGPNVTWSPEHELAIVAGIESIAERLARVRRSAIRAAFDALRKDVEKGRQQSEQLRQVADAARRGEERWDAGRRRSVEDRERTVRDLIERLKQLARLLAEDPSTRSLARNAAQIADLEAEAARAMFERARQQPDSARLVEDLRRAGERLSTVAERLEELRRKLESGDQEGARRAQLRELADRQQRLADEAARGGPRDRVELDRLSARQNAVRNELDALLRQMPDLRRDLLEAEAREADRLARAAQDLSARQREVTRRSGDLSGHAGELKQLAEAQRHLEDDVRRLALDVDAPLSENGRARTNVEEVRQAAEAIERGDVDPARQRLEGSENELRRLVRDLEDVPTDAKALALRLIRRQDALNAEISQTLNPLRERDKLSKDEKDALNDRLRSLGRRQESIARLAASIRPPESPQSRSRFPDAAAREAADKTRRAAEAFRQPTAQVLDERKNEARQALDRLYNELPDWWRRNEFNRQKFDEARRVTNEMFNQIAQHLRETEPRPDRPSTSETAAEELARRLGDAPDRLAAARRALKEMEPETRVQPQRDRAVRAAEELERILRDLREAARRETARTALSAAEVQARAAMDRLDHKFNGRTPADDLAAELARDQRELVGRLAEAKGDEAAAVRVEAAEDQRRLAIAMRALNVPDAALERADAVRQAERAARALSAPSRGPDDAAAVRAAADAADRLVARLSGRQSVRDRVATLARAERRLNDPEAASDPATASKHQKAIAAELALQKVDGKEEAAALVARATELDERAFEFDEEPGSSRPSADQRIDAHSRAAQALDALAARADGDRPKSPADSGKRSAATAAPDPELPLQGQHLAAAGEMVRRQRQIRERLQAILGRQAEPEELVRREAVRIGQELFQLRDRIRPISDRGVYPAMEAGHHLRAYAEQALQQATEHLAQGQASYARDAQRRASENLERGAQRAEDLAAALRAERLALPAITPPKVAGAGAPPPVGSARRDIARAVQQLEVARDPSRAARATPEAQDAMQRAARDLMAAAEAADPVANDPGMAESGLDESNDPSERTRPAPGGTPRDSRAQPGQVAEVDLAELKEAIRRGTGRTWGELPGHLRTEILRGARGRYREDYARLIQLYFREIAAGGAANPEK